jgi:uncharacterized membrane protein
MTTGVTPAQLLGLGLLTCLVAAVLGAKPLATWVDNSIVADTVVQQAADEWLALTQRLGLDRPYDVLRQAVREAEGPH